MLRSLVGSEMCIRDSRRASSEPIRATSTPPETAFASTFPGICLLYTSDAADDLTRVDLGGRRIIQAADGIRDAQESRGLGDVYKRQPPGFLGTYKGDIDAAGNSLRKHLSRY